MDEQAFETIKRQLRTRWPEVQAIAVQAPVSETITNLLATVGGPSTVEELSISRN